MLHTDTSTPKIISKIDPCPINEAIMEVRFNTSIDEAAVFGMVYSQVKDEFTKTSDLPVLQIPAALRKKEPNLLYAPYYRLTKKNNKDILIQLGPRTFSVIITNKYDGWDTFLPEIEYGLEKLKAADIVEKVTRIGLRYLNFFETNIFTNGNLSIMLGEKTLDKCFTQMRVEIPDGEFINALSVNNRASKRIGNTLVSGSLVDIDTHLAKEIPNFFENKTQILKDCHNAEKKIFSSIPSNEYLKKFNEVKYE